AHFTRHDLAALVFPVVTIPPPKIGETGEVTIGGRTVPRGLTMARNVSLGSCASMASLVLPGGLTRAGLPVGLEFDSPPGTDRRLLGLGLSLERIIRSEEHTSELQSRVDLVCRLLLEKK